MTAPRSIAELPFVEGEVLEVLGLADETRTTVDTDYVGFGWARAARVWLADGDGGDGVAVDDALLVAVHAADDGAALADDVELEFALDDAAVVTLLSRFLEVWLPRLPATASIVLVTCNPHRAVLARPRATGDRPVWYGLGAVDSWLDLDPHRLRLVAHDGWRQAHAREAP